eukprot:3996278-Lingulodinium_polyedra.AAC.1
MQGVSEVFRFHDRAGPRLVLTSPRAPAGSSDEDSSGRARGGARQPASHPAGAFIRGGSASSPGQRGQ